MAPVPVKQGSVTVTVPVAVWSYPERTKLHTRSTQGSLVTTLSCFLGLNQVPQFDLSCLLYFKKLASEPHQECCVLSLLGRHGPALCCCPCYTALPHSFSAFCKVNLPHPSRLSSSVGFPFTKTFLVPLNGVSRNYRGRVERTWALE